MTVQAQEVKAVETVAVAAKGKRTAKATPTTKVADKVVEKAPKAAAAKPAKATANKAKPKAATGVNFSLMAGVRPTSGANLYAHTQAVLELTGMAKGKGASKSLLAMVMGETAVRYNMKEGKFETNAKGEIVLTAGGAAQFAARNVDAANVELFKSLLSTGKPNALCKNGDFIRKVS